MYIILLTTGICVTKAVLPFFVTWVLSYITTQSTLEISLRRREREIKRTLDGLSIVDEFAKYAKLQRQLHKIQQELTDATNHRWSRYMKRKLAIKYGVQLLYAFLLLLIIWYYKYTPAVILPTEWTAPFNPVMSWPTGVEGGISISFWLLMIETTTRIIFSKIVLLR